MRIRVRVTYVVPFPILAIHARPFLAAWCYPGGDLGKIMPQPDAGTLKAGTRRIETDLSIYSYPVVVLGALYIRVRTWLLVPGQGVVREHVTGRRATGGTAGQNN